MPARDDADAGSRPPRSRTSRLRTIILGAVVALLLMGLGSIATIVWQHVIDADRDEVTVVGFKNWRVVCPPPSQTTATCVLNMDVVRDQGGLALRLSLSDTAPNSLLTITVLHGVLLDPGLGFSIDGGATKTRPYETCDSVGCIAALILDEDTFSAMKRGSKGQVAVVPGNGRAVNIPFSLEGFAGGVAELESARRWRAFWSFLD